LGTQAGSKAPVDAAIVMISLVVMARFLPCTVAPELGMACCSDLLLLLRAAAAYCALHTARKMHASSKLRLVPQLGCMAGAACWGLLKLLLLLWCMLRHCWRQLIACNKIRWSLEHKLSDYHDSMAERSFETGSVQRTVSQFPQHTT
jgi:hypothetical protein